MDAVLLAKVVMFVVGFQVARFVPYGLVSAVKKLRSALGVQWRDPLDEATEGFLEGIAEEPSWRVLAAMAALVWGTLLVLASIG